jgi:hypothetical protein
MLASPSLSRQDDRIEIVRSLLREGAAVDIVDSKGMTPLYIAVHSGRVEAARLLLGARADPTRKVDGWSALDLVQREGADDGLRQLMLEHQTGPEHAAPIPAPSAPSASASAPPPARPATERDASFPAGWSRVHDATSGRDFYFHKATGGKSWEPPTDVVPADPIAAPLPSDGTLLERLRVVALQVTLTPTLTLSLTITLPHLNHNPYPNPHPHRNPHRNRHPYRNPHPHPHPHRNPHRHPHPDRIPHPHPITRLTP